MSQKRKLYKCVYQGGITLRSATLYYGEITDFRSLQQRGVKLESNLADQIQHQVSLGHLIEVHNVHSKKVKEMKQKEGNGVDLNKIEGLNSSKVKDSNSLNPDEPPVEAKHVFIENPPQPQKGQPSFIENPENDPQPQTLVPQSPQQPA